MKMKTNQFTTLLLLAVFTSAACSETAEDAPETHTGFGDELSIGDIQGLDDMKADGWGFATVCKPIPNLTPLNDPMITISLDGLSLHLVDRAGTYDEVFPIGVGQIDDDGESLTPVSTYRNDQLFYTRTDLPSTIDGSTASTARWAWNYSCRMWWTDDDGKKVPVFAGLPFIRLTGPRSNGYGIHGPVDRFSRSDGGTLRRGYVSHGCIRMEAADLVEVYALIAGKSVPVRIQQATERDQNDRAVDVDSRWIMSECQNDSDCSFQGGVCHQNEYSGRGFCTQPCSRYCPDRDGYPGTFCVADDQNPDAGMCVFQSSSLSNVCRRFDHFVQHRTTRFNQSWVRRNVCLPGSEGWIGDRCLDDADCESSYCHEIDGESAGVCSEACTRYCPDLDGHAGTFCVSSDPAAPQNGGMCVARCAGNDACGLGTTCESTSRHSQASVVRDACVPY